MCREQETEGAWTWYATRPGTFLRQMGERERLAIREIEC